MLSVKRVLLLTGAGLVAVAVGALMVLRSGPDPGRADAENAEQVALGDVLYAAHCAVCHGDRLQGQPNWRQRNQDGKLPAPPHDDTGHTWHHADMELFRITKGGLKPPLAPEGYKSDMPAFGDTLGDADIWAILSFIKGTWSPRERSSQDRIDKAYRRAATER